MLVEVDNFSLQKRRDGRFPARGAFVGDIVGSHSSREGHGVVVDAVNVHLDRPAIRPAVFRWYGKGRLPKGAFSGGIEGGSAEARIEVLAVNGGGVMWRSGEAGRSRAVVVAVGMAVGRAAGGSGVIQ